MPGAPRSGPLEDLEAQINEDAAAAAPSPPPARVEPPATDTEPHDMGRAGLTAVPPLEDGGPDTEAWHRDEMGPLDDPITGTAGGDAGSWRLGAGRADWTA